MALNSTSKLGKAIGGMASEQDDIKQNISPDEAASDDQFVMFESLILNGTVSLTKLLYPTDSFIIDHPVYGEIDSSVLQIDGGYDTGDPEHNTVMETQSF